MSSSKLTELLPEPSESPPLIGARVPNVSLQLPGLAVANRNQPVVAAPRGLAEPRSRAPVPVRLMAVDVDTEGAAAGVVKDSTAPMAVP